MSSTASPAVRVRAARLVRVQQVFLALALPVLLLALGARLVATPAFLWLEYHRPGFPADHWGMGTAERLTYGSYGLDYVMNFAPPEYLADLLDEDGGPLFAPGEVAHMHDVQGVIHWGFAIAVLLLALTVLSCAYLHRRSPGSASGALFFGSWLTVALLVVCAVAAVFAWQWFFAAFHALFFDSGTWTFRITDTLIRLYPTQFWTDAALVVALVAVVGAFVTMLVTYRRGRGVSGAPSGAAASPRAGVSGARAVTTRSDASSRTGAVALRADDPASRSGASSRTGADAVTSRSGAPVCRTDAVASRTDNPASRSASTSPSTDVSSRSSADASSGHASRPEDPPRPAPWA